MPGPKNWTCDTITLAVELYNPKTKKNERRDLTVTTEGLRLVGCEIIGAEVGAQWHHLLQHDAVFKGDGGDVDLKKGQRLVYTTESQPVDLGADDEGLHARAAEADRKPEKVQGPRS